jgi:hypothetical protein
MSLILINVTARIINILHFCDTQFCVTQTCQASNFKGYGKFGMTFIVRNVYHYMNFGRNFIHIHFHFRHKIDCKRELKFLCWAPMPRINQTRRNNSIQNVRVTQINGSRDKFGDNGKRKYRGLCVEERVCALPVEPRLIHLYASSSLPEPISRRHSREATAPQGAEKYQIFVRRLKLHIEIERERENASRLFCTASLSIRGQKKLK